MKCAYCDEALSEEELEGPRQTPGGEPICDTCYDELFTFTCSLCEERGDKEDQHKMLVVWDEEEAEVPSGLYRVIKFPYYVVGVACGGWLIPWAVERIDNAPEEPEDNYFACGHLCGECQEEYRKAFDALREMNS